MGRTSAKARAYAWPSACSRYLIVYPHPMGKVSALPGLGLLFVVGCAGAGSGTAQFDPTTEQRLTAAVDDIFTANNLPGVIVGIIAPGQGELYLTRGVSDKVTKTSIPYNSHFRVGSNTKSFIGTVVLQLVDEGFCKLDDKISKYLTGVPSGDLSTIRMMLNMTSGLPNYSAQPEFDDMLHADPYHQYTRQALLDIAYAHAMDFDPGTAYRYSNTNTVLLGILIETLTSKTVAQNLQTRIFDRLGMNDTSWPTTTTLPSPFVHGYTKDTADKSEADSTNWNVSWADAAGILVSTPDDMRKWSKALATGTLISPAMQIERFKFVSLPGSSSVARYGLAVSQLGGWIGHEGEMPGYNSTAVYLPSKDITLVIFVSTDVHTGILTNVDKIHIALGKILAPDETPDGPPGG